MYLAIRTVGCADTGALDRSRRFHRPAAGEVLFTAEKDPKRLAPGARRCGSCRTDALRVSPNSGRHQLGHPCLRSLRSLRLRVAAPRLARSNSGPVLPHSATMLAVLYGAGSHWARARPEELTSEHHPLMRIP